MIFAERSPKEWAITDKIENNVARITTGRCPIFARIKDVVHTKSGITVINKKPDETRVEYKTSNPSN